jgi:hypothetical protein
MKKLFVILLPLAAAVTATFGQTFKGSTCTIGGCWPSGNTSVVNVQLIGDTYHARLWTPTGSPTCAVTVESSSNASSWKKSSVMTSQNCGVYGTTNASGIVANRERVWPTINGSVTVAFTMQGLRLAPGGGTLGNGATQVQINNTGRPFDAIATVPAGSVLTSQGPSSVPAFQIRSSYDVQDYGFVCNGATSNNAEAARLLNIIGSRPATVRFQQDCALGTIAFPGNVTLDFSSGGSIKVITSTTITILGGIVDPDMHQIFLNATGANGAVDFAQNTGITAVEPEWWGAGVNASATTNTAALQAAEHAAFGTNRTASSGLGIWNKTLDLNAQYQIKGELRFYHVIGAAGSRFEVKCNNGGITQTTANLRIIDSQSMAYGRFDDCYWASTGTDTSTGGPTGGGTPDLDIDYNGSQGSDLAPQFLDFWDNTFNGNQLRDVGILIAKSGGAAQGSTINLWNNECESFTGSCFQIGGDGIGRNVGRTLAENAIENTIFQGDFESNHNFGAAAYGGSFSVEYTSFEDGFESQLLSGNYESTNKAGYDIYGYANQSPINIYRVRSESRKLVACQDCNVRDSYTINQAIPVSPGTFPANDIVQGSPVAWDGQYYQVTTRGQFGGVGSFVSPLIASGGSATTLVDTNETVAGSVANGVFVGGETVTQASTGSMARLLNLPASRYQIAGTLTSGNPIYQETATQTGTGAHGLVYSDTSIQLVLSTLIGTPNGSGTWTGGTSGFIFTPSGTPVAQPANPIMLITASTGSPNGSNIWTGGKSGATYTPTGAPTATAGWTTNAFSATPMFVSVTGGTNAGCYGTVTSNTANTITLSGGWTTKFYGIDCSAPALGSAFMVEPAWNGGRGTITSGTVVLTPMNEDMIGSCAGCAGFGALIENVSAPGGKLYINNSTIINGLGVTTTVWNEPLGSSNTTSPTQTPYVNINWKGIVAGQTISYLGDTFYQNSNFTYNVGGTPYTGPFRNTVGTVPTVWGCGAITSQYGCDEVWIGGRSTPVENDNHLEYGGIFEPPVPTTPLGNPLNQNGFNAVFGAGRGTGSGTPGEIQWLLSAAGSSGVTPQTESVAMTLGQSGLNIASGYSVTSPEFCIGASCITSWPAGGSLTSVSVTTANGVSGSVANPTTAPAITLILGAIAPTSLVTTGIVDGTVPVTITTGTTANLGSTHSSGFTLNQEAAAAAAVTYTLPATVAGKQYCVSNSGTTGVINTGVLTVYPPASSYVILNGVVNAIGGGGTHGVVSAGAAGDAACFIAIDSTHWQVFVSAGSWTEN